MTERREYRQGRYVYLLDDNSFSNILNLKQVFIPNGAEKPMCNIPLGKINTYEQ